MSGVLIATNCLILVVALYFQCRLGTPQQVRWGAGRWGGREVGRGGMGRREVGRGARGNRGGERGVWWRMAGGRLRGAQTCSSAGKLPGGEPAPRSVVMTHVAPQSAPCSLTCPARVTCPARATCPALVTCHVPCLTPGGGREAETVRHEEGVQTTPCEHDGRVGFCHRDDTQACNQPSKRLLFRHGWVVALISLQWLWRVRLRPLRRGKGSQGGRQGSGGRGGRG